MIAPARVARLGWETGGAKKILEHNQSVYVMYPTGVRLDGLKSMKVRRHVRPLA